ncbi:MAG: DUF1837 domain-containing protein [Leptospiraceae bacterium]|nr:DUF1837 domain-containing protein [Leptospiraceae bacterium]
MNDFIDKLIGKHPEAPDFFSDWLICEDMPIPTDQQNKKHRKLTEQDDKRDNAVEQIAKWLLKHHFMPSKLERLIRKKELLDKYNLLPKSDKTKKGAFGEIIFTEYLLSVTNLVVSFYRLRFNGNTDQSLKGDDILFFDKENMKNKILLGESKYISDASGTGKATIQKIVDGLKNGKLPLSLSQVEAELDKVGDTGLADLISELLADLPNYKDKIVYVGFLMGNKMDSPPSADIVHQVETHLNSDNPKFAMISLGIKESVAFIEKAYEKANKLYENLDDAIKTEIFTNEQRQLVVPIPSRNE